jgi:hypothetical protein
VGLTQQQIAELLKPKVQVSNAPPQTGPLRYYDREMRCASRGCGSPTYTKVEHVPLCMTHALRKLNELVVQVTELREKDLMA